MEHKLLAASLLNKSNYEIISQHITKDEFSPQASIIFKIIGEYYEADPESERVDRDIITSRIHRSVSNPSHHSSFDNLVDDLFSLDVSSINVIKELIDTKKSNVGLTISGKLAANAKDNEVRPLIEEWINLSDSVDLDESGEVINNIEVKSLVEEKLTRDNLIQIAPTALNNRIDGGAIRGNHILVYGRPEIGKSLMVINMMYYFAKQNLKVLYVDNEEPVAITALRLIGRMADMTKMEIVENPEKAQKIVIENGYDNIWMVELYPGSLKEIDVLTKEHRPDVLIVNQIRNLNMYDDNRVIQLEKAARGMREIGKKHNVLVVSITQAGDSAENKNVLEQGDVDFSNTGIPAAVDLMIGIGANKEYQQQNKRMISLPKNKLAAGNSGAFFQVVFDPTKTKVIS